MTGKDQQFLLDHVSYKGNQSLIQLHILMFYDSSDPCLRLQSQGDNSMCINSVQFSLGAIAPCRTYRLSDTLKRAQRSRVVVVLQQLTHGWSQRVAPMAHHESNPSSHAQNKSTAWPGPSVRKTQNPVLLCVVVTSPMIPTGFHARSLKPATTGALSDIFTFPKMYWLHGQF